MIQRIQSLWLFIAAMLNGALFISKIYAVDAAGVTTPFGVRDSGNFWLFLLAAIITLLPLVTIFLFMDRKKQRGLAWLSVIGCITFVALAIMKAQNVANDAAGIKVQYDFGMFLPIAAIVFLMLAISGIKKDDKLVKSMERLR